jgi:lysophospholipid acyltransferase (LPLAT)-like uncharacterized protein
MNAKKKHRKRFVPPRWLVELVAGLARLWRLTWQPRFRDPLQVIDRERPWPFIFVMWHNRLSLMTTPFPLHLRRGASVLVSASQDGETATRVANAFAFHAFRGSSSRGGVAALHDLRRVLESNRSVILTVDGPRGPRYEPQPGAVLLAEQTGVPIVPFCLNAFQRWELRSWDRHQLPRFFATAEVATGRPLYIPPNLTAEERERHRQRLRSALLRVTLDDRDPGWAPPAGQVQAVTAAGCWRLLPGLDAATAQTLVDAHAAALAAGTTAVLKNDRKRALTRVVHAGRSWVVKEYRRPGPWGPFRADARAWRQNQRLHGWDMPVPACPGWLRGRDGRGWLILEDVGQTSLYWALKLAPPERHGRLLQYAATIIARLQRRRIWHRDLKVGNFLCDEAAVGRPAMHLVDLDDVRFGAADTAARRARNLAAFVTSAQAFTASPRAWRRFWAAYRRESGFSKPELAAVRACLAERLGTPF